MVKSAFIILAAILLFSTTALAQKNNGDTSSAVAQYKAELRKQLATQSISASQSDAVATTETTFAAELKNIAAQTTLLTRDREIKLNAAHVARRKALMDIVHTGRAMEDVVDVSDRLMRKYFW